jgi:hypothetical protein
LPSQEAHPPDDPTVASLLAEIQRLESALRQKEEENAMLKTQLERTNSDQSKQLFNSVLSMTPSGAAALENNSQPAEEDPQIPRQITLLREEVLPDIDRPRSEHVQNLLQGGMTIVNLFSTIETKPVPDDAFPSLKFRSGFENGSHIGYTETRGVVRGSAAAIIAKRLDVEDWSSLKLVEKVCSHHMVLKSESSLPPPFHPRDIVVDAIWAKNPKPTMPSQFQEQFIFIAWPTTHQRAQETKINVRGRAWEVTLLNQISPERTELISMAKLDLGGSIPHRISNSIIRSNNGSRLQDVQASFLCRLPLSRCVDTDGPSFAYAFLEKHEHKSNKAFADSSFNVATVINAHRSLREVSRDFAAFGHIIAAILEGRLGVPFKCDVGLILLTPVQAVRMGSNLSTCLLSNTQPIVAVNEWINTYRALGELRDLYPWYEPMVNTLAVSILRKGNAGLRARVILGLVLSTLDVVTDALMVMQFKRDGEDYFANVTIACCCTCIFINIILVVAQHHKAGLWKVLLEILFVVTFTKPAVDAYTVSSGQEKTEFMSFDPILEFMSGKGIELACEAIPGSIIQMYALLIVPPSKRSMTAVISIAVSLGTTAFTSVMITYDMDNDPSRRRDQPMMYGITGDEPGQKIACFAAIYVMAFTHVAGRILAAAMCTAVSGTLTMWTLLGEMILYMVYKLFRRDFTYWVPIDSPSYAAVFSFVCRLVRKIVFDFAGLLQERHPYEMGGQVFLLSMIWAQVFPYVAKDVYYSHFEAEIFNIALEDGTVVEESNLLDKETLDFVLPLLTTVWACAVATLVYNMDRDSLASFFTSMTGHEYTVSLFRASDDDASKFSAIFGNTDSHTLSIRSEVKTWVLENYERWDLEKPAWFNEANISCIPNDMIPIPNLEALLEAGGGERPKRNSLLMPRVSLREARDPEETA